MVGRKRAPVDGTQKLLPQNPGQADLNEVVAYNFRQARELRGWTQDEAAIALEPLLGQRLPQASISAIERAYEGDRRREFDAQEILAFALAFNLPLVWFFLPPPGDHRTLERTTNIVSELYGVVFGREDQLGPFTTAYVSSASTSLAKLTKQSRTSLARQAGSARRAISNGARKCSSPFSTSTATTSIAPPMRWAPSSTTYAKLASAVSWRNVWMTRTTFTGRGLRSRAGRQGTETRGPVANWQPGPWFAQGRPRPTLA